VITLTARPRWGSTSTAHCRPCGEIRTFAYAGSQNGKGPLVNLWTCRTDSYTRIQMADLPDAEGLAKTVLDRAMAANGAYVDSYQDALQLMMTELWDLFTVWDPTRGVRFTAYATGLLRLRVNNVWRSTLGKSTPKLDTNAASWDALVEEGAGLGGAFASSAGDPSVDRSPGLGRVLAQGDRPTLQPLPPRAPGPSAAAPGHRELGEHLHARAQTRDRRPGGR
jgi:hypothetical protein